MSAQKWAGGRDVRGGTRAPTRSGPGFGPSVSPWQVCHRRLSDQGRLPPHSSPITRYFYLIKRYLIRQLGIQDSNLY